MVFSALIEVERDLCIKANAEVIVHYTLLFKKLSAKTSDVCI